MGICIENSCRIVHFCPKQHVKSYPKCTKLCQTPGIIFHIMPDTRNTWIWLVVVTSIKWKICWYERHNISNYGEIENPVAKLCRTLCMSVRHNLPQVCRTLMSVLPPPLPLYINIYNSFSDCPKTIMLSFENGFNNTTTMTVQNTIFTTTFVPMDSFESWTFPLGEAEKKICWTA